MASNETTGPRITEWCNTESQRRAAHSRPCIRSLVLRRKTGTVVLRRKTHKPPSTRLEGLPGPCTTRLEGLPGLLPRPQENLLPRPGRGRVTTRLEGRLLPRPQENLMEP